MVEHVVVPRMREHERRSDSSEQVDDFAICRFIKHDIHVAFADAVIFGPHQFSGCHCFAATDFRDLAGWQHGRAAVSRGGGRNVDLPANVS